jgi:hypothetical protein
VRTVDWLFRKIDPHHRARPMWGRRRAGHVTLCDGGRQAAWPPASAGQPKTGSCGGPPIPDWRRVLDKRKEPTNRAERQAEHERRYPKRQDEARKLRQGFSREVTTAQPLASGSTLSPNPSLSLYSGGSLL